MVDNDQNYSASFSFKTDDASVNKSAQSIDRLRASFINLQNSLKLAGTPELIKTLYAIDALVKNATGKRLDDLLRLDPAGAAQYAKEVKTATTFLGSAARGAQDMWTATRSAATEQERMNAAAREQVGTQERLLYLQQRIADAARTRANQESATSGIGQLRSTMFGGSMPSTGGGSGTRNFARMPSFLQFSAFPAANLANTLGAQGLARGIFTAGDVVGAAEAVQLFGGQIEIIATRFREMNNVFGRLATGASAATKGLGATASNLIGVGAAVAPVALAIAGVALVLGEINRLYEQGAAAGKAYAKALQEISNAIAGGATVSDLREQVARAQRQRNFLAAQGADLVRLRQLYDEMLGASVLDPDFLERRRTVEQQIRDELGDQTLRDPIAITSALRAAINENQTVITGLTQTIDQNTAVIESGVIPAIQYQEKMAAINAELERGKTVMEQFLGVGITRFDRAFGVGVEQRDSFTQRTLDAKTQGFEFGRSFGQSAADAAVDEYERRLKSGTMTRTFGVGTSNEPGKVQLAWNALIGRLAESRPVIEEIADAIRSFNEESARIAYERRLAADREFEDFGIQRMRAYRDFALAQAEADEDEALRQERLRKQEEKRRIDFEKRLRQILEDLADDQLEAVGRRDALAYVQNERAAAKQIRRLQDQMKDENEEREEAERDREQDRQRARQRQLQYFQRRLADEDYDRSVRLRRQMEDYIRQDQLRMQDQQRRINQLSVQLNLESFYNSALVQNFSQMALSVRGALLNIFYGMPGGTTGGGTAFPPLPPAAAPFPGFAVPTADYTEYTGRLASGGVVQPTINIYDATDPRRVGVVVNQVLRQYTEN